MAEDIKKGKKSGPKDFEQRRKTVSPKKGAAKVSLDTDKKKPVKNEYTMTKNNKVKTISEGKFERVSNRLVKRGGSSTGSNLTVSQTAYSKSGNKSVNRTDVNNAKKAQAAAKSASTNLKGSNPFQKN